MHDACKWVDGKAGRCLHFMNPMYGREFHIGELELFPAIKGRNNDDVLLRPYLNSDQLVESWSMPVTALHNETKESDCATKAFDQESGARNPMPVCENSVEALTVNDEDWQQNITDGIFVDKDKLNRQPAPAIKSMGLMGRDNRMNVAVTTICQAARTRRACSIRMKPRDYDRIAVQEAIAGLNWGELMASGAKSLACYNPAENLDVVVSMIERILHFESRANTADMSTKILGCAY
jgi:hypothetical protein